MIRTLLGVALVSIALTGCGGWGARSEPVVIEQRISTIPVFHPPLPDGIGTLPVEWTVLTPKLMEEYLDDLDKGEAPVIVYYALTPQGYKALSENMAVLKRYIKESRAILAYYRKNLKRMAPPPEPVPAKKAEAPKPVAEAEEATTFALPSVSLPSFLGGEGQ
jgi:hypothetical protein